MGRKKRCVNPRIYPSQMNWCAACSDLAWWFLDIHRLLKSLNISNSVKASRLGIADVSAWSMTDENEWEKHTHRNLINIAFQSLEISHFQMHTFTGGQHEILGRECDWHDCLLCNRKLEIVQKRCQTQPNLHHGKTQSDTISWTFTEWQPRHCITLRDSIACEPLRSKLFRFGIEGGIMVNAINWYEAQCSFLNDMLRTGNFVIVECLTGQQGGWRVLAKCFCFQIKSDKYGKHFKCQILWVYHWWFARPGPSPILSRTCTGRHSSPTVAESPFEFSLVDPNSTQARTVRMSAWRPLSRIRPKRKDNLELRYLALSLHSLHDSSIWS